MPRIFPPTRTEIPKGYWRNGQGSTDTKTFWGKVKVTTQRLVSKAGQQAQVPLDASLDSSGWSPKALQRLLDLTVRLPFEEASVVAHNFALKASASELERLAQPYGDSCRSAVTELLLTSKEQSNTAASRPGRMMILQIDGVYALGRPEDGSCPGIEIKSAVLYPQRSPGERWMIAEVTTAAEFLEQVSGLLQQAAVTPVDTLIGLGDGAAWVENIFDHLGATRITDVYHACEYLDTVMQALGWQEEKRRLERRAWYRGEVNARDWLKEHQPQPGITHGWEEEAVIALRYLAARVASMDYATFTTAGYPIGSGQVEAMNKSVIGTRMKRSGMHWSRQGAARMASQRAQHCAKHPLIRYHHLRHQAYPATALSP